MSKADDLEYLRSKGVAKLVEEALSEMCKERPDDPHKFFSEYFAKRGAAPADIETLARVACRGPAAVEVEAGKTYYWCSCGHSKKQPFCDGSHMKVNEEKGTDFKPKKWDASKTETVYFCQCKRTKNPPMCDGTHTKIPEAKTPEAAGEPDIEDLGKKPRVACNKPIAIEVEQGKTYYWCSCGHSKKQPFCDGSHVTVNKESGTNFGPKKWEADATGTTYFCQCKQTKNPPKCDGTHSKIPDSEVAPAEGGVYTEMLLHAGPATSTASAPAKAPPAETADIEDLDKKPKIACRGPIPVEVKEGETYYWCSCGHSKNQPFCDGSHRAVNETLGTKFAPVPWTATATTTVDFCGCKRTQEVPICDMTHIELEDGDEPVVRKFVDFEVVSVTDHTHDTKHIVLRSKEGTCEELPESYHFTVTSPDGKKTRPYTPVRYAPKDGVVELLVKSMKGGAVSPLVCAVTPGSTLALKGPIPGEYHCAKRTPSSITLIAAGSGVTPIIQLLHVAVSRNIDAYFFYSNKTVGDIMWRDEVTALEKGNPCIKCVHHCITDQADDVPEDFTKGRISKGIIFEKTAAPSASHDAVICGPPGFNKAVFQMLLDGGFSKEQIFIM